MAAGSALKSFSSLAAQAATGKTRSFIPSAAEGGIKLYSPAYYATCTVGGIPSCGLTHMAVTPLDVVKCNMQVRLTSRATLRFIARRFRKSL